MSEYTAPGSPCDPAERHGLNNYGLAGLTHSHCPGFPFRRSRPHNVRYLRTTRERMGTSLKHPRASTEVEVRRYEWLPRRNRNPGSAG